MIIATELAERLIAAGRLLFGDYFITIEGEYYITHKKLNLI
jgi:hypothetical protein